MYNTVGIWKLTIQKPESFILRVGLSMVGLYVKAAVYDFTICKQDRNVQCLYGIQNLDHSITALFLTFQNLD